MSRSVRDVVQCHLMTGGQTMGMRVGFIGCGAISGSHMNALAQIPGVTLAAFADVRVEAAAEAARRHGGASYADWRLMLEREKPDACYICVPPFAHEGQEETCLDLGIPFFVEKPVGLDLARASAIARRVEQRGLVTAVGYSLRSSEPVAHARQALAGKRIAAVRGTYYGDVPGAGRKWHGERARSGGQVVEQATHAVDLMRHLAGDIRCVSSYGFTGINRERFPVYDVEDASATAVRFASGAVGTLACTWLWPGWILAVEFLCRDLLVTYEWGRVTVDSGGERVTRTSSENPVAPQARRFIEAVRAGDPGLVACDYADGAKTLAVTLAVNASMERGIPVDVPGAR